MTSAPFRGLRRDIAVAARGRSRRTLYELSKAIGRRPGDIQRIVRQMHGEALLHANSHEPTRGTLFWFNEEYADALDEALVDDRSMGQLVVEQRVVQIAAPEDADLYSVLGRGELNGLVSWAAEWGGDGEWLIGMVQGTPKLAADRLVGALRDANIRCQQRRVGELLSADALRRLIDGVGDARDSEVVTG